MELKQYEEFVFPGFAPNPEDILKAVNDLEYRQGDVLICAYPKSENHWNKSLIRCLLRNENVLSQSSIIELNHPDFIREMESPRVFFTHLWPHRIPPEHVKNRGKMVMVLRNPKDVLVASYFHFTRAVLYGNTLKWDDYFEEFMTGNVPFGSVFTYLQKWDEALKDDRFDIECFYFEDHKDNAIDTLRRLAKHIGVKKTDDELASIVAECSLESLKSKVDPTTIHIGVKDDQNQSVIFRKGEIGDWKNHFTVAQNDRFEKILKDKLNNVRFTFRYE